ncbi:MAG: hypothetical protein MJ094_05075 [Saccharofermentans sp.]|nr:hypothetical protein [Saccharofermentans sp.]
MLVRKNSIFNRFVAVLLAIIVIFTIAEPACAASRYEKFELMWMNATDEERYYMPSEVKAYACGLSTYDFIFFARVIEGEGADDVDNITDKVLVAITVLNRTNCGRWPTSRVLSTLQRPGQFEVVNSETHECHCARSLDSEWSIVMAYRLVEQRAVSCHMVYYNAYGFTGYSRQFTNYAYFGGNYFSVIDCSCDSCLQRQPEDWDINEVEMMPDDFVVLRPSNVEAHYV